MFQPKNFVILYMKIQLLNKTQLLIVIERKQTSQITMLGQISNIFQLTNSSCQLGKHFILAGTVSLSLGDPDPFIWWTQVMQEIFQHQTIKDHSPFSGNWHADGSGNSFQHSPSSKQTRGSNSDESFMMPHVI